MIPAQAARRLLGAAVAVAVALVAQPHAARAAERDYCDKVRARAAADAALLFSPRLVLQGIRFPSAGRVDVGVTVGSDRELRLALSASVLDVYRGIRVMRAGDADCEQQEATTPIQELLLQGPDLGRLPALRKQAAFLETSRATWEKVVEAEEQRQRARLASLVDLTSIRTKARDLERSLLRVRGDLARLEERGFDKPHGSFTALARQHAAATMQYERELSHLRSLDAFEANVLVGLVPHVDLVDWYGVVQLSFKPGFFFNRWKERRYLEARDSEVRRGRFEPEPQLEALGRLVAANVALARRELDLLDRQIDFLSRTRTVIEGTDAPSALHAMAELALEEIAARSDRTYLQAWMDELLAYAEDHRD